MNIIITLLVFTALVVVHEWGHYKVAVKNGILVEEFSIGMGPLIYYWYKGETMFSIRALPLGGFCRMLGEENGESDSRAFCNKSTWKRMAVVVMGPVMNFILCFVLVLGLVTTSSGVVFTEVSQVLEGTNAIEQGLEAGDTITKINGQKIHTYDDLLLVMKGCDGKDIAVEVKDENGNKEVLTITPYASDGRWLVGFSPVIKTGLFEERIEGYDKITIGETIEQSVYTMAYYVKSVVVGFVRIFTFNIDPEDVSGPIGIVEVVGDTVEKSMKYGIGVAIKSVLSIMALLSVNLGVINLFPIPAMDG
ncbi:MAG: site-2 protease family protein, partial [Firmicutes bacterium]|nr:site-2 protease family protein [Bacillota bacterium]